MITTSALAVARTYLGIHEKAGRDHSARVVAMLQQVMPWVTDDEVPWCGVFAFEVCLRLGLARPDHPERARSWLTVGDPVELFEARADSDIVILRRGNSHAGPEVLSAPGHVGFYVARMPGQVEILGGNQSDAVTSQRFLQADVLGVRRLA